MPDDARDTEKREQGRRLAIEGILRSRFGDRDCTAARRALETLRSSADAAPEAGKKAERRGTRKARRKSNEGRRRPPRTGTAWPTWAKVSLALAAVLLLLLTGRLFIQDGQRDGEGKDTIAAQPPTKGTSTTPPTRRDPETVLASELAWTETLVAKSTPSPKKEKPITFGAGPQKKGKGAAERPTIGGPPRPEQGVRRGGPSVGSPKTGTAKGGPPLIGAAPATGTKPRKYAGELDAAIDACIRKLTFKLRIPKQLPSDYRLIALTSNKTGNGVMLSYRKGETAARVFVNSSVGPDTPFRKTKVGKRKLMVARKRALLFAIEDGPSGTECEAWARAFLSP